MNIRPAAALEIDIIMDIYDHAKRYMNETGNSTQWIDGYPCQSNIMNDIYNGHCFVGVDDSNIPHFVFAFIIGEEPTYSSITHGEWQNSDKYGTIHRLASDGMVHGVFKMCLEFCLALISNIRIDTHADNLIMQHLIKKNQFKRCGIIYVANGSERIAYQLKK